MRLPRFDDYISLSGIARYRNTQEPSSIINNWMRGRINMELLSLREKLNNEKFKPLEFDKFGTEVGIKYSVLSSQRWIEAMQAISN